VPSVGVKVETTDALMLLRKDEAAVRMLLHTAGVNCDPPAATAELFITPGRYQRGLPPRYEAAMGKLMQTATCGARAAPAPVPGMTAWVDCA
jgi:hypothetical protein